MALFGWCIANQHHMCLGFFWSPSKGEDVHCSCKCHDDK